MSGARERIKQVQNLKFGELNVELTATRGGTASRCTWQRMHPIERRHDGEGWIPEHEEVVAPQQVIMTRRAGERKYHYFEQCGALQWGHCRVNKHEADSEGCTECKQCRSQRIIRTWDPVPKMPTDAKWESYAPQGSDK